MKNVSNNTTSTLLTECWTSVINVMIVFGMFSRYMSKFLCWVLSFFCRILRSFCCASRSAKRDNKNEDVTASISMNDEQTQIITTECNTERDNGVNGVNGDNGDNDNNGDNGDNGDNSDSVFISKLKVTDIEELTKEERRYIAEMRIAKMEKTKNIRKNVNSRLVTTNKSIEKEIMQHKQFIRDISS